MADACAAAANQTGLVEGLLSSTDCHIADLVQTGYGALAGPESHLIAALTAVLTIYVALLGLRLMLGLGALRVGDLTLAAVKIGVVLALATNWPLYHRLVFETLFHGPEQLAGELLMGSAAGKPIEALRGGLQLAFDEMQAAAHVYAQKTPGGASPWLGGAGFSAAALNLSSVLMLVSTLGVLLGLKIVLAALLVAGPVFLGFFLFQSTRGIFVGWLRAAIGLALAPLFALLALVLQLQLVQPHLADLAAMRAQGGADAGAGPAVAVLVITLTTAMVTLAGLATSGVVGFSLRLPLGRSASAAPTSATGAAAGAAWVERAAAPPTDFEPPPRIAAVASAAAALERRDSRLLLEQAGHGRPAGVSNYSPQGASEFTRQAGVSRRRSAQPPASASSLRRDR
ncbi:type IV secretion system protein [Phenylobacterium sp. LjRoot225]|uniref:type IV secretion system protein n=1 Tax=Phenylobacterium sp. LjRoot225 TaxID=3342285 RepID=UPI003ECCABF9